jgi:SAM-dependent methyltransferase
MEKSKKTKGVDGKFAYKEYWDDRYKRGQNSGSGSYGKNADFKSKIINKLIDDYGCRDMVEFGCGDGNQMSLFTPISYIGYDISPTIIEVNKTKYSNLKHASFDVMDMNGEFDNMRDLSVCVDVLFHLTIEEDWMCLIDHVCRSAKKIVVFTTNTEEIQEEYFPHVNFKRKILPVLDMREDVIIDEIITQPTHKETNTIILKKVKGLSKN